MQPALWLWVLQEEAQVHTAWVVLPLLSDQIHLKFQRHQLAKDPSRPQ
jgi:hypothetical protein